MVWDTLNPKYSPNSAMSFFITVDLPDPLGPQRTSGLGGAGGGLDLRSIVTLWIFGYCWLRQELMEVVSLSVCVTQVCL